MLEIAEYEGIVPGRSYSQCACIFHYDVQYDAEGYTSYFIISNFINIKYLLKVSLNQELEKSHTTAFLCTEE